MERKKKHNLIIANVKVDQLEGEGEGKWKYLGVVLGVNGEWEHQQEATSDRGSP